MDHGWHSLQKKLARSQINDLTFSTTKSKLIFVATGNTALSCTQARPKAWPEFTVNATAQSSWLKRRCFHAFQWRNLMMLSRCQRMLSSCFGPDAFWNVSFQAHKIVQAATFGCFGISDSSCLKKNKHMTYSSKWHQEQGWELVNILQESGPWDPATKPEQILLGQISK